MNFGCSRAGKSRARRLGWADFEKSGSGSRWVGPGGGGPGRGRPGGGPKFRACLPPPTLFWRHLPCDFVVIDVQ